MPVGGQKVRGKGIIRTGVYIRCPASESRPIDLLRLGTGPLRVCPGPALWWGLCHPVLHYHASRSSTPLKYRHSLTTFMLITHPCQCVYRRTNPYDAHAQMWSSRHILSTSPTDSIKHLRYRDTYMCMCRNSHRQIHNLRTLSIRFCSHIHIHAHSFFPRPRFPALPHLWNTTRASIHPKPTRHAHKQTLDRRHILSTPPPHPPTRWNTCTMGIHATRRCMQISHKRTPIYIHLVHTFSGCTFILTYDHAALHHTKTPQNLTHTHTSPNTDTHFQPPKKIGSSAPTNVFDSSRVR